MKMSEISEVSNFLSRKAWILTKRRIVKEKVINQVPIKLLFKSKK